MGAAASIESEELISEQRASELAGDSWNETHSEKFKTLLDGKDGLKMKEIFTHFAEYLPDIPEDKESTQAELESGRSIRFFCAVDGSNPAHNAFETAANFVNETTKASTHTTLEVIHVESDKDYLGVEFKSSNIQTRYETAFVTTLSKPEVGIYRSLCKEVGSEESTKDVLIKYMNDTASGIALGEDCFMVTGITGRKSPDGKPTIFGEVSGTTMRQCRFPTLVIRGSVDFSTPNVFMIATDLSNRATEGYSQIRHLVREQDSVIFTTIFSGQSEVGEEIPKVQAKYEKFFAEQNIKNAKYVTVQQNAGQSVADCMCSWALDNDIAFMVVTIRYRDRFGSTGEGLAANATNKSNMIFVKERATFETMTE